MLEENERKIKEGGGDGFVTFLVFFTNIAFISHTLNEKRVTFYPLNVSSSPVSFLDYYNIEVFLSYIRK